MRFVSALVIAVALSIAVASPASAGTVDRMSGSVAGSVDSRGANTDVCPPNPYPDITPVEELSVLEGTIARPGPDLHLHIDFCAIQSGALGGTGYEGFFVISGPEGTASGTITAVQGSPPYDPASALLTITRGTKAYTHTSGQLLFVACFVGGGSLWNDVDLTLAFTTAKFDAVTGGPRVDCPRDV
jgi:hypothetical protein